MNLIRHWEVIERQGGRKSVIHISLSRKNLLSLLTKLTHPDSQRTLRREVDDSTTIVVTAEPDETHYSSRAAGRMSDQTEADLAEIESSSHSLIGAEHVN